MRALVCGLACLAAPCFAQDAFEIQVYDSETAARGQLGAELHVNYVAVGSTTVPQGEHPTNHALHLTLEPHVGLASWCEAGLYLLTALDPDGHYDFAGVKARFKVRWPEKLAGVVGLSLNQELSLTGGTWDPTAGYGWEFRPIVDVDLAHAYFAFNPIIGAELSGPAAGTWSFEPALKAGYKVLDALLLGAEYYGAWDLAGPSPGNHSQRLFGTVDVEWAVGRLAFALQAGVGYDFWGPDKLVAKLILSTDLLSSAAQGSKR